MGLPPNRSRPLIYAFSFGLIGFQVNPVTLYGSNGLESNTGV